MPTWKENCSAENDKHWNVLVDTSKKNKNIVSSFASIVAVLSPLKIQDINVNAC